MIKHQLKEVGTYFVFVSVDKAVNTLLLFDVNLMFIGGYILKRFRVENLCQLFKIYPFVNSNTFQNTLFSEIDVINKHELSTQSLYLRLKYFLSIYF